MWRENRHNGRDRSLNVHTLSYSKVLPWNSYSSSLRFPIGSNHLIATCCNPIAAGFLERLLALVSEKLSTLNGPFAHVETNVVGEEGS